MSNKLKGYKKSGYTNPALIDALWATVAPLVSCLDDSGKAMTEEMSAGDTGVQNRSAQDVGLRITMSNIIQQLHNQYAGIVPVKGGTVRQIDTLNQRVLKAENDLADYIKRFTDDNGETNYDMVMGQARYWNLTQWLEQQQARLSFVGQNLDAWQTIYLHVFREAWKPYVVTESTTNKPADISKLSEAVIAANRAKMKALATKAVARS
jgi:hypothetical protein